MRVTNNAPGLRGIHTRVGVTYLDAGESRDLDLTEGNLADARAKPFLSFDEPAKDHEPAAPAAQPKPRRGRKPRATKARG